MFQLKVDLIKGDILKSLLLFALPMFVSNIFQQLYNTMDTMIVGNFLGDASLAAIGASGSVYELLVGFALGIGSGLSIITAKNFGANDETMVKKSVAGSIIIGVFVTIAIMIFSCLWLYPLLELLNTPSNIITEAYDYISVITISVGVMFAYNLCAGLLRAIGNSFMPLIFLIISSILNVVLDLLFITQFGMGIKGAAIATVLAQGFSVILCLMYILRKAKILIPNKKHFSVGKNLYKDLVGQGLSMGFMMSIVSAGTAILQTAINNLGYLVIAGHTAARKLNNFCMMPGFSIGVALSTFVSQNKGANQAERIKKAVHYANLISIVWGAIATMLLLFCAPLLVKLLSGSSEAIVIENGAKYLMVNAPFYAILGMLVNFRNGLQGLGSKILPLISSIIEFFGKIIFVIIFIPTLGYFGVIICEPVIWCCMCAQLAYSFYRNPYMRKSE